jgi:hypothetical protein
MGFICRTAQVIPPEVRASVSTVFWCELRKLLAIGAASANSFPKSQYFALNRGETKLQLKGSSGLSFASASDPKTYLWLTSAPRVCREIPKGGQHLHCWLFNA